MSIARLLHRYRDREYPIIRKADVDGPTWAIFVENAWYRLGDDPEARGFVRERLRSVASDPRPALLASKRYPLMLVVDRAHVLAWPQFLPRGRWSKTYINQLTGERVGATRGPVWLVKVDRLDPVEGGIATVEQAPADIVDVVRSYLRKRAER